MNDIDPNKIIPFNDCKGSCKTPVGCSCGKSEMEEDSHLVQTVSIQVEDAVVLEEVVEVESKICTCGKNPGGTCGCSAEGKESGSGCCCKTKAKKGGCGCCPGANKLEVYDWMAEMPDLVEPEKMIEVQFKNTRKGYYLNSNDLELYKGDVVAVEASPGHDIGEVTLTGKLVQLQMKNNNYRGETKRVYRLAKPNDIEKYEEAKKREHKTMLRAREIAEELELGMKISDVEFQGDGNKAIFYYIADGRVDFRQLIKHYASEFRVKIEMKQIGARQEAGRVGGIGPCGRELCCSSSMSNFVSVSTSAARLQDIPLNPQKLAGQCGKLKCCLNFEVDVYIEAQKKLPPKETPLETKDSTFYHFKTDILSGRMTYSTDKNFAANLVELHKDKVFDILRMNKKGEKPESLQNLSMKEEPSVRHDILDQDSIHRFDGEERRPVKKGGRKVRKPRENKKDDIAGKTDNKTNETEVAKNISKGNNNRDRRNNSNTARPNNKVAIKRTNREKEVKDVKGGQQQKAPRQNNQRRNNNRENKGHNQNEAKSDS